VIAAALLLPRLVATPRAQALIASHLAQALGRPARFTSLSITLFARPAVAVRGLEVAEDPAFGPTPFLRLDEARLQLRLRPLLAGRLEFAGLVLRQPTISLVQASDGRWNIATLGSTSEPRTPRPRSSGGTTAGGGGAGAVLASRVTIEQGRVLYEVRGPATGSRYRLEGLDLSLVPSAGAISFSGDGRVEPGALAFKITDGGIGPVAARTWLDAPLRGRLTLDGKDIKNLVAVALGPDPSLAGALKGALTLAGTAGKPRASGQIELTNVTVTQTQPGCPEPRRRTLTLPFLTVSAAWEDGRFTGRPLSTSLAGGTITTNLTAHIDRHVVVELDDLAVKGLPVERVLVDFMCHSEAVSGPLALIGATAFTSGDILNTLSGAGQVRIGPGRIVGGQALATLENIARMSGVVGSLLNSGMPVGPSSLAEFDSITGTWRAQRGVLSTRDLLFNGRAVKATIAGQYALARGTLNFDVVATLAGRNVKAKVSGTAAAPSISVVPASILSPEDAGRLEKGLQDLLKQLR
jgi:hypothetical protein